MSKIVVLFNLKAGVAVDAYEEWARTTDLPIVNDLQSVQSFEVLKTTSLLGSDTAPPYQYVEILDLEDFGLFGEEVGSDTMQRVASEFQAMAEAPLFIVTEHI